jgi:3-isopropylmalate/(R)-2-methylmalate dehydratase large subunit
MPENIIDKIWDAHIVSSQEGRPDIFFIDLQLMHEVTSPQAFDMLRKNGGSVFSPRRNVATIDHSIPTDPSQKQYADELNRKQVDTLRRNCKDFDIPLFDIGSGHQGVVHVIGPELGLTQPGMTIVCGDSHTATHGAFGALAFGIGTTQISHVLETSCIFMNRPKTLRVSFSGTPSRYFRAKDAILALIQTIGVQGGTGYVLEYAGDFIRELPMEQRMTLCNMSIECGARAGLIAPDEITFKFLEDTEYGQEGVLEKKSYWESFVTDDGATFDAEVQIDIEGRKPIVTWGTTPAQSVSIDGDIPVEQELSKDQAALAEKSLEYTKLSFGQSISGTKIQNVFVGSCTNGRLSDLEEVAEVVKGKKIADGVRMFVVPGSEQVEQKAREKGLDDIFRDSGIEFRKPGCSACLAMNGDIIPPGKRCASTSNRNFIGRQGPGSITHLMSPLMAAIAGVMGKITDPQDFFRE